MKFLIIAAAAALSVAWAEDAHHKTEEKSKKLPFVGVEGNKEYQEIYLAQPLSGRWELHSLTYRTKSEEDHRYETVAFIGPAFKAFHYKGLEGTFGAGLYGGQHQPLGPALLGELAYHSRWAKGEAVLLQNLRKPHHHGRRDEYFVWYFGPQFPCWQKNTCEAAYAQDDIGHDAERERLKGIRLAAPIPFLKHTKAHVKIMSHRTLLFGLQFQP